VPFIAAVLRMHAFGMAVAIKGTPGPNARRSKSFLVTFFQKSNCLPYPLIFHFIIDMITRFI
jgi:hypothetical protein